MKIALDNFFPTDRNNPTDVFWVFYPLASSIRWEYFEVKNHEIEY